jgi:hypothetical protein
MLVSYLRLLRESPVDKTSRSPSVKYAEILFDILIVTVAVSCTAVRHIWLHNDVREVLME